MHYPISASTSRRATRVAGGLLLPVLGLFLSLGGVRPAHAQLTFTLLPTSQSGPANSTLAFSALLKNTGSTNLFLNTDGYTLGLPAGVSGHLDDTNFFNLPVDLTPGQSVTAPLFNVFLTSAPVGVAYSGSFTIFGGSNANSANSLGTQSFQVSVSPPSVPEAGTLPALGAGLTLLTLLTVVQRRRRAGVPLPSA